MCLKLWKNHILKSLFSHMCFLGSEKAIFVGLLVSKQMTPTVYVTIAPALWQRARGALRLSFPYFPAMATEAKNQGTKPTLCPTDGFQGLAGD